MTVVSRITQLIGQTPILQLPLRDRSKKLYLKLEKFNPGQSMKDRMACSMIEAAERSGKLSPGGTIVESTSGNTGIGIAMVAAERGYKFIAVVDHHAAKDKIRIMQALGAETYFVEAQEGELATGLREETALTLGQKLGAFVPEQGDNPSNAQGYEQTLARELWEELGEGLDGLIASVGTGGSLSGTSKGLKALHPRVHTFGVEPEGSIIFGGPGKPYYQSGTGTPGGVEIGANVNFEVIDSGHTVNDQQAFNTARFLASRFGLLVGGSAGGVIYKALEILHGNNAVHSMVAIVADGGERYLDTIFNDDWMQERDLLSENVQQELTNWLHINHA